MKIVSQSATLIAASVLAQTPPEELMRSASEGALAIEAAARTCYKSEGLISPGSAAKLITKLAGMHHDAMLEFGDATFRIVCDRGVSHEIVRHRIASYAQESTRYCNYASEKRGGEIAVIMPPGLDEWQRREWEDAMLRAEAAYLNLVDHGAAPQIARSVLPTCLKTEICVKMNFREWLHFLKLRTAPAAHPQMREVAGMVRRELIDLCPEVFDREVNA